MHRVLASQYLTGDACSANRDFVGVAFPAPVVAAASPVPAKSTGDGLPGMVDILSVLNNWGACSQIDSDSSTWLKSRH